MSINNHEGNLLFLVCPFCQLENFIINHYGEVFFLTAPASIFHFEGDGLQAVKEFITRKDIKGIYLVGETSCNFTKNVLDNSNHSGLRCENEILKLKSDDDSLYSLTEKILKDQAYILRGTDFFGDQIESENVSLHILIIDKKNDTIKEIK